MELSINISGQGFSQRDEKFRKWKAESFPPDLDVPDDTEPKKMMDEELYNYAKEDRFDELFRELHRVSSAELSSIFYRQVGPWGNPLLHVATSHGSKYVTELLLYHFPPLINRKNFQHDTALHLAARGGQLQTTSILVNEAKSHGGATNFVTFMETQNDRGNTALHDAVINCHQDVARFLVSEHIKLSYIENRERKSPLYLAVETTADNQGDEKMLAILLHAIPDEVDLLKMLEGKSPVHAAVQKRKKNIVVQIANKKPELLRRKDGKEANPLHCAATMGYVCETRYLFDEYRDGAIEQNGEGNLPIHVASINGHVHVVDVYISKWTHATEFLNSKGQNILHVAAESGQFRMVKHILEHDILEHEKLRALVNAKDRDGNTPLHLASKSGRSIATYTLVRNKMVMREIANGENLTPYQVAEKQCKIAEAEYLEEPILNAKDNQVDRKNDKDGVKQQPKSKIDYNGLLMTMSILHFFADSQNFKLDYFPIHSRPLSKGDINNRIGALLVVAVLIASVTYSGVLQLPKSGSDSEREISNMNPPFQNQAMPVSERILRYVYMHIDQVAFNSSVMASIALCWAQLNDTKVAARVVGFASVLTGGALFLMCSAFMLAVAVDASKNSVFFGFVIFFEVEFVLLQIVISSAWIFPSFANKIVEKVLLPQIYFFTFILYFVLELSHLSKFRNSIEKKVEQEQTTCS